jgi:hypothetical protein
VRGFVLGIEISALVWADPNGWFVVSRLRIKGLLGGGGLLFSICSLYQFSLAALLAPLLGGPEAYIGGRR